MRALILSCGKASRLSPFSDFEPKVKLPFLGGTLLDHHIKVLLGWGITKIDVVVNTNICREYSLYVDGVCVNVHAIEYGWDSTWRFAASLFHHEQVLIINCDILVSDKYKDALSFHALSNAELTIVCRDNPELEVGRHGKYAYFEQRDGRLNKHEIQDFCGAQRICEIGMSIVSPCIWELVSKLSMHTPDPWMEEMIPLAIKQGMAVSYVSFNAFFRDIGSWGDLYNGYEDAISLFPEYRYARIDSNSIVENGCNITESFVLPGAIIHTNVKLNKCIIMQSCTIDNDVFLDHCIVLPNTRIFRKYTANSVVLYESGKAVMRRDLR